MSLAIAITGTALAGEPNSPTCVNPGEINSTPPRKKACLALLAAVKTNFSHK